MLILASASPRRAELLSQIGIDFRVMPSHAREIPDPGAATPQAQAISLARAKARQTAAALAKKYPRRKFLVLGVDTMVWLGSKALPKPGSAAQARSMLQALSGRGHKVVSGMALLDTAAAKEWTSAETTRVFFRKISNAEIEDYVRSGEPMDKAGAYGIQGRAGGFVRRLEGCYYNVVGLPLARLEEMLTSFPAAFP